LLAARGTGRAARFSWSTEAAALDWALLLLCHRSLIDTADYLYVPHRPLRSVSLRPRARGSRRPSSSEHSPPSSPPERTERCEFGLGWGIIGQRIEIGSPGQGHAIAIYHCYGTQRFPLHGLDICGFLVMPKVFSFSFIYKLARRTSQMRWRHL
jgi:hypothetical protein